VRDFERQPGPVRAVAFSQNGKLVAASGGFPEVHVYRTTDGTRAAVLKGHEGGIFALAFHPTKDQIAAGGYDGKVRIYDAEKGDLVRQFFPVPLEKEPAETAMSAR